MHLSDKAADRWHLFRHEFPLTWQGLSDLLMREFGTCNLSDCQGALIKLSQSGSVDAYIDQVTMLSRRVLGFSSHTQQSFFISGLKEHIQVHVRALQPKPLYHACELAKIFEAKELQTRSQFQSVTPLRGQLPRKAIAPPAQ